MSVSNPAYRVRRTLMHRTTVLEEPDGCWEWRGKVTAPGYGLLSGSTRYVHDAAYEEYCGPIPAGHRVVQTCGNHRCWRPEHLTTVDAALVHAQ